MRFIAYDLLEDQGRDIRSELLKQRRQQLDILLKQIDHPEQWRLSASPCWPPASWQDLDQEREHARLRRAEGLMLKRIDPLPRRPQRGHWWTSSADDPGCGAALCPAGSGRRANLFTDYTLALE